MAQRKKYASRSRDRGRAFEYRVANKLGGMVWPGQDGDVEARGYRIECKRREKWKLNSTTELSDFMEQVQRYRKGWPKGKKWALALHGGGRTPTLICIPIEDFELLTREVEESDSLVELVQRNAHVFRQVLELAGMEGHEQDS